MKNFDVQSIDLSVPRSKAFAFIADPAKLQAWTHAFVSVTYERAVMRTPAGEITIDLKVNASAEHGTIDWCMTFRDGSVATAFSRIVETGRDRCVYSFILTPPPVPLEQLEGALDVQSRTLAQELSKLKGILEHHA
ncbi:MAG: SRPBCC family protein [Gammaproteobacteria bacterium]|nr:SRPBCC family protein [Gammaproteobacteria bacterium]